MNVAIRRQRKQPWRRLSNFRITMGQSFVLQPARHSRVKLIKRLPRSRNYCVAMKHLTYWPFGLSFLLVLNEQPRRETSSNDLKVILQAPTFLRFIYPGDMPH